MNLGYIYATAIAKFNASKFVGYGNSLFETIKLKANPIDPNHLTSLGNYNASFNTQQEEIPNAEPLKTFIIESAKEYCTAIGGDTDAYEFHVNNIWLNEMKSKGEHRAHQHYGSNFSGCFYVRLPRGSGCITFETALNRFDKADLKPKEFTIHNSHKWNAIPNEGDLLLWESHVVHSVPPETFEGTRRSIGFDVHLKERNT